MKNCILCLLGLSSSNIQICLNVTNMQKTKKSVSGQIFFHSTVYMSYAVSPTVAAGTSWE